MTTGWVFDLVFIAVVAVVTATVFYIIWLTEVKHVLGRRDSDGWGADNSSDRASLLPPPVGPFPDDFRHVHPLPREAYDWEDAR